MTRLEQLPGQIDDLTLQVSQLRTEMRDEFSAVRTEMAAGFAAVRGEIADGTDRLEAKTDSLATHMRMLHEDVIARMALSQEGLTAATKRKSRERKR